MANPIQINLDGKTIKERLEGKDAKKGAKLTVTAEQFGDKITQMEWLTPSAIDIMVVKPEVKPENESFEIKSKSLVSGLYLRGRGKIKFSNGEELNFGELTKRIKIDKSLIDNNSNKITFKKESDNALVEDLLVDYRIDTTLLPKGSDGKILYNIDGDWVPVDFTEILEDKYGLKISDLIFLVNNPIDQTS